jgi:hypothetical protein
MITAKTGISSTKSTLATATSKHLFVLFIRLVDLESVHSLQAVYFQWLGSLLKQPFTLIAQLDLTTNAISVLVPSGFNADQFVQ